MSGAVRQSCSVMLARHACLQTGWLGNSLIPARRYELPLVSELLLTVAATSQVSLASSTPGFVPPSQNQPKPKTSPLPFLLPFGSSLPFLFAYRNLSHGANTPAAGTIGRDYTQRSRWEVTPADTFACVSTQFTAMLFATSASGRALEAQRSSEADSSQAYGNLRQGQGLQERYSPHNAFIEVVGSKNDLSLDCSSDTF